MLVESIHILGQCFANHTTRTLNHLACLLQLYHQHKLQICICHRLIWLLKVRGLEHIQPEWLDHLEWCPRMKLFLCRWWWTNEHYHYNSYVCASRKYWTDDLYVVQKTSVYWVEHVRCFYLNYFFSVVFLKISFITCIEASQLAVFPGFCRVLSPSLELFLIITGHNLF